LHREGSGQNQSSKDSVSAYPRGSGRNREIWTLKSFHQNNQEENLAHCRTSHYRTAAIALIGSAALGAPAIADSAPATAALLPDASIVVHESNGKSTVIPIDEKIAQMLLSDPEAKPLEANVIVFVANHQTYMVKDHKMPNNDMMVASILRNYVPPAGGG
jgi:hypothetical protein